ncbi:hypothetical protein A3Q56_08479 [Intoshia linei]|uniref:Uncharacterized protein n=1 Tax=Intoshia linei TaxID=1819745 RepID=A0A177AP77_9BILA|nr:hypothetical protein A3Q56_08479 [Intoshia linei]
MTRKVQKSDSYDHDNYEPIIRVKSKDNMIYKERNERLRKIKKPIKFKDYVLNIRHEKFKDNHIDLKLLKLIHLADTHFRENFVFNQIMEI